MVIAYQIIGYSFVVFQQRVPRPKAVAIHMIEITAQLHLVIQLRVDRIHVGRIHGAYHILPDIKVPSVGMVIPPIDKCFDTSRLVAYFPIELRQHIVDPPVACPQQYIGIKLVVILQPVRGTAIGIALLVPIDSKGADSEADPRFAGLDNFAQFFDQQIHILPSPIASLHTVSIAGITVVVGKFAARNGIRIKIVVHVNGIDIVASYNIVDHLADELAAFGQTRVEVELLAILYKPFGMLIINM